MTQDLPPGTYAVRLTSLGAATSVQLTVRGTPTSQPLVAINAGLDNQFGSGLVRADRAVGVALGEALTASPLAGADEAVNNYDDLNLVQAGAAWDAGITGKGVVVAVIDSGVNLTSSKLQGRIYTNGGEIPGNGVDDDGN